MSKKSAKKVAKSKKTAKAASKKPAARKAARALPFNPDSPDEFAALLKAIGACEPAQEWCAGKSLRQALAECRSDEWMRWFLYRWSPTRRDEFARLTIEQIRKSLTAEEVAATINQQERGRIVHVGIGGTATAGYGGTATAGIGGTATAGDRGTATAGYGGTATAGIGGTATAGYGGTATAGYGGTATAGDRGTVSIKWFDPAKGRYRTRVAEVGEDGVEAGRKYQLDEHGKFVWVEAAATT